MDKKLKNAELALLLMLVSLPLLLRLYSENVTIFWALLGVLDVAMVSFVDELFIVHHYLEIMQSERGRRIRLYMSAMTLGYVLIGLKSFGLMLILLGNDMLLSVLQMVQVFIKRKRK